MTGLQFNKIVSYFDSYANPLNGATVTVSGGYGTNVSGSTDANGYYSLSLKPTSIGGPFALSFTVTSAFGNYSTIQDNLTVTAPIVVPVDKVLAGTVIAGQTGTMTNNVGSGTVITPGSADQVIPKGYFGGALVDGKVIGDADLVASNIKSGIKIFGVTGTYGATAIHGSQVYAAPGTFSFTVPAGVTKLSIVVIGGGGGGGAANGHRSDSGQGGSAGSGGAYIDTISVFPGQVLPVKVGAGGVGGNEAVSAERTGTDGKSSYVGSYTASGGGKGLSANDCGYGTAGAGTGGIGGGAGGYNGLPGNNGYWGNGGGESLNRMGVNPGGLAPGTGGAGGIHGSGGNGGPGRVTIMW